MRVYLPAEARPELEVTPTGDGVQAPIGAGILRAGDYGLLSESLRDDALLAVWSGRRWVCPRTPRLRMLEGVLAFHNGYAEIGGALVVPETIARRAARELERIYSHRPATRSHILTSPWHVPLRWFVAFDPSEREVQEVGAGHTIRYRTIRREASARLDKAIAVLDDVGMDGNVLDEVRELGSWLLAFPEDSMVELDYDTVAGLFSSEELVLDDSAAEVWASIQALREGNWEEAGEHYTVVAGRWAPAMAVTYAN